MSRGRSVRVRRITNAVLIVAVAGALAVAVPFLLPGNDPPAPDHGASATGITDELGRRLPDDHPRTHYVEASAAFGLAVRHGPAVRRSVLPEDMGSGVALEDFDGDGDLDLFVVGFAGNVGAGHAESAAPPEEGATHRLFRNDGGRFVDVTDASGLATRDFGIGVAAGDVDGDGRLDLYVTAYGPNRLFLNRGGLRFEEATAKAGVGDPGFGAGAGFADVDRDGDLDLYVCNYVDFRWDGEKAEASEWGGYSLPYTLNPSSFAPAANRFYRNRGDGTFEEVAAALGLHDPEGRSLGCAFADFNDDGWPDLYVLNDISKNAYFENRGDGTFEDRSLASAGADYRGAMGNAVGDLDEDGDLDLFITHWIAQENGLYVNLVREVEQRTGAPAALMFMDKANLWGLGATGLSYVGWGAAMFDYDLDGAVDLAVVNGSTMPSDADPTRLTPQPPQLFWHKRGERLFEIGAEAGAVWTKPISGRGLAEGDLDGDGDLDLVVTENCGPLHVWRNEGPVGGRITVRLQAPGGNRFGIGARVRVTSQGVTQMKEVGAGSSYLCHRPLELVFGLGAAAAADVEVRWPDGRLTHRKAVPAGTRLEIAPDA